MNFDLAMTDDLLATTRAVRKRLDLDRPVPREVINECLELAVQAPTGSNRQTWRWLVIDDAGKRAALGEIYRACANEYLFAAHEAAREGGDAQTIRVFESALWLAENMARVPALMIPCVDGRLADGSAAMAAAGYFASIYPAVWSFQLALRARGLGSTLTTLHLLREAEVAELLGIPEDVMQVAMLPVGYTRGTDFKRAARPPVSEVTHWNRW